MGGANPPSSVGLIPSAWDVSDNSAMISSKGMPVHQNLPTLLSRLLPLGDTSSINAACITNAKAPNDVSIFMPYHKICAIAAEFHRWATSKFGNDYGSLDGVSVASIHSSLFIVMIGW